MQYFDISDILLSMELLYGNGVGSTVENYSVFSLHHQGYSGSKTLLQQNLY